MVTSCESEKNKPVSKGDGSRNNPIRDKDDDAEPRLGFAKDIRFMELDGSPGLSYRKGKTNQLSVDAYYCQQPNFIKN